MSIAADKSLPQGAVHHDIVVPACEPWSAHVKKGDILRLVDLEGQ